MRVFRKEITDLRGKRQEVVYRVGDGSIIKLFDRTSPPQNPTDVVCPHFLELKWANGCYFNCAWCYLNGTFRFHPEWKNGKPNIKNFHKVDSSLETLVSDDGSKPTILNAGELSDSLLAENVTGKRRPFSEFLINALSKCDHKRNLKILFLTKSTDVGNLLRLAEEGTTRIVMSFTLNADCVARRWEKKAPTVDSRIRAARRVFEAGYKTRIRIDPIVPIEGWRDHYTELIDGIFSNLRPERITLGSLRGLTSTITHARDKSWIVYLSERSNWGKKVDSDLRYEIYSTLLAQLKMKYRYDDIALCKETIEVWSRLGLNFEQIKCNCTI